MKAVAPSSPSHIHRSILIAHLRFLLSKPIGVLAGGEPDSSKIATNQERGISMDTKNKAFFLFDRNIRRLYMLRTG